MKQKVLVRNLFLEVGKHQAKQPVELASLSTVLSNLAYYGYAPSVEIFALLQAYSQKNLVEFWKEVEPVLQEVTGANRKMDNFVVYKNFPKEVLDLSHAHYWFNQILMYIGAPNSWFLQEEVERPKVTEKMNLKVLQLANGDTLADIFSALKKNPARWSDNQTEDANFLFKNLKIKTVSLSDYSFKENGIVLAKNFFNVSYIKIKMENATDVLRLASALSDGDISLREKVKFKNFKRPVRKVLLELLDNSKNLLEDISLRPETFKRLLERLHPGDYHFDNVSNAYSLLYKKEYQTFNAVVESKLQAQDVAVLKDLSHRPGEFVRKIHLLSNKFGEEVVVEFSKIVSKLKTIQLLKLDNYLLTINHRNQLIYAPKGNWTKAQFVKNEKTTLPEKVVDGLHAVISGEIKNRLNLLFPQGVDLDLNTANIKLQTNDQKLANYGRGTVFPIPENINFIRSASYWKMSGYGNTWFDNGWNFFDKSWQLLDTCCWNSVNIKNDAAIFSGDPTNSKEMEGRACQMIDLYIDKLVSNGIRYAVWNVLCYSHVPFSKAEDVLATLQWGEKAEEGKLYEPNRAQMVFPLKGDNLTKYVAYVDLVERKLVYMDANLYGNVQSATYNGQTLSEKMPAFVEYLKALPSVADLFIHAPQGTTPVLYSDKDIVLEQGTSAYVFKPENSGNVFSPISLEELLN